MRIERGLISHTWTRWAITGFLVTALGLAHSVSIAATYALEIIQPRAGLTTNNRYYRAYPNLAYDVQISAIGGKYPYQFSLTTAPSGMAIDPKTGIITWPNPVAQSQAYAVGAQVKDANGATANVQWTVTVTTQGFKFMDGINGKTIAQGGDGSLANPWKSIADWYVTKYDTSNRGIFLYWRNGTYRTTEAPIEDGWRLATSGSKPVVWLAYPGQAPVIDTTGSHISLDSGSNTYFEGMTFQNFTTNFGIRIGSAANDVVFRKNFLRNLPAGAGGAGTNASAIMIAKGESKGRYWSFIDNQFSGVHDVGYGILGYATDRVLVQGNRFTDFTVSDSKAIGPKMDNTLWFIRDNRINISSGQGIWVDTYSATGDIEVSYNLVQVGSGYAAWFGQELATYGPITSLRNTYVGAPVRVDNLTLTSGPVSFANDVIVNNSTGTSKIVSSVLSLVQLGSLLTGSTTSGIVDSNGNLAGNYTQYIGAYGYQRTSSTIEPLPPTSVTVN